MDIAPIRQVFPLNVRFRQVDFFVDVDEDGPVAHRVQFVVHLMKCPSGVLAPEVSTDTRTRIPDLSELPVG